MKVSCLSEETLSNYEAGRLSGLRKRYVERHLSRCESCLEAIIVSRTITDRGHLIDTEVAPIGVIRRAIMATKSMGDEKWNDRVISYFRAWNIGWSIRWRLMRSKALFSVRGHKNVLTEDFCFVRKTYHDLKLEIGIEKTSQNTAHVRVNLNKGACPNRPIRVSLYRNNHEREVASFLFDDAPVLFENISHGHYALVFLRNGNEVGRYRFHLKEGFREQ